MHEGRVWAVASGDYYVAGSSADAAEDNPTCAPFEPVRCHCFITESTFGLPIYRWQAQAELFAGIDDWWRANAEAGRASLLMGYALGKAQRILMGVDRSIGPIFVHGAVEPLNRAYRAAGVDLPETPSATEVKDKSLFRGALIVAPPSAQGSTWTRRFGDYSDARSRAAGCSCAARAAAARSTAASSSATTPTGRGCSARSPPRAPSASSSRTATRR